MRVRADWVCCVCFMPLCSPFELSSARVDRTGIPSHAFRHCRGPLTSRRLKDTNATTLVQARSDFIAHTVSILNEHWPERRSYLDPHQPECRADPAVQGASPVAAPVRPMYTHCRVAAGRARPMPLGQRSRWRAVCVGMCT